MLTTMRRWVNRKIVVVGIMKAVIVVERLLRGLVERSFMVEDRSESINVASRTAVVVSHGGGLVARKMIAGLVEGS